MPHISYILNKSFLMHAPLHKITSLFNIPVLLQCSYPYSGILLSKLFVYQFSLPIF